MSNFSLKASHEYWLGFKDQSVYRIILAMESIESSWVLQNTEQLDNSLEELQNCILNMEGLDADFSENIIKIISCLNTSQMLRILQALDEVSPGAAAKVLEYAERASKDNASAKVFLSRNYE